MVVVRAAAAMGAAPGAERAAAARAAGRARAEVATAAREARAVGSVVGLVEVAMA